MQEPGSQNQRRFLKLYVMYSERMWKIGTIWTWWRRTTNRQSWARRWEPSRL